MICFTVRRIAATLALLTVSVASAGAQQVEATSGLAPHIRAQLWPERELSPVEQEFKDNIIVLRDTLAAVDGASALLERQVRAGTSMAVIRSSGRTIANNCAKSARASGVMKDYAAGLSTDNARWGEPAIRSFRVGVDRLVRAMGVCQEAIGAELARDSGPRAARLAELVGTARLAVGEYTRSADDLIRTLKVPIDPRGSGGKQD